MKCLEKDLKKRFGNCDEFAMTLKNQNKIFNKIEKTIQHKDKNEASDKLSKSTNIENKSPEIPKKKRNFGRFLLGFLILIVIALSILYYLNIKSSGTKQPGKHPGFENTADGLYYKFYHKSGDTTQLKLTEYALVKMVYGTPDSVLFDSRNLPAAQRPMKIPIIKSIYKGDIYEGLEMMHVFRVMPILFSQSYSVCGSFPNLLIPLKISILLSSWWVCKLCSRCRLRKVPV